MDSLCPGLVQNESKANRLISICTKPAQTKFLSPNFIPGQTKWTLANRQDEAIACHHLGLSYRALKQYDKVIELLEQSLAIKEELGNKSGQAAAVTASARVGGRLRT